MRPSTDILLVEDEAEQAELQDLILQAEGWSVLHARDGEHALGLLGGHSARVILLDMVMPRLDGFGVLRALGPAVRDQPIVAMSSFPEFLPEALKLGAADALPKPFEVDALVGAVRRAMAGERPERPQAQAPQASAALPGVGALEAAELQRVERLHALKVMVKEPDAVLDTLAQATSELLQVPICLVSLVTATRQEFKGMCGLTGELAQERGTPRSLSFCAHAVAARAPLIVSNAGEHPVFADNALVRQGLFNAYAGVPIEIPGVGALGTLCVLDRGGRRFTAADLSLLGLMARRVAAEIEWRERDRQAGRPLGTFRYLSMVDEVHGIYNAQAFRAFADVLARQALEQEASMGLVAVQRSPFDRRNREDPVAHLAEALAATVPKGAVLGWLDDRALAAAVPRLGEEGAWDLLCQVLREEATRRTSLDPALLPALGAAAACENAFRAEGSLRALRWRLDAALERHRGMVAPEPSLPVQGA